MLFYRPWQSLVVLFAFLVNMLGPLPLVQAQDFRLPAPGVMVHLSPPLDPPIFKGIKVHPDNPFRFDFILDKGDSQLSNDAIKDESSKLIKYFLASLTIPEKDLWVNLSPYEKNRIVPESFGQTEMGRDLLAEDYMLKQITASLIYPEDEIGKKFWKRIYEGAAKKFGTTNIPVNTFNKVWIVPEKAVVYENTKAGTAYVVEAKLKVMLEQDYLALEKNNEKSLSFPNAFVGNPGNAQTLDPRLKHSGVTDVSNLGSQIVREIVIPELTKEVNENKNFTQLRQVYNSLILATWYKKKIKDSILLQVYADKNKIKGLSFPNANQTLSSPNASVGDPEHIYQQYLQAFKKGVYNYIKEEIDPITQETIPRKYFSGGVTCLGIDRAMIIRPLEGAWEYIKGMLIKSTIYEVQSGVEDVRGKTPGGNEIFLSVDMGKNSAWKEEYLQGGLYLGNNIRNSGQLVHDLAMKSRNIRENIVSLAVIMIFVGTFLGSNFIMPKYREHKQEYKSFFNTRTIEISRVRNYRAILPPSNAKTTDQLVLMLNERIQESLNGAVIPLDDSSVIKPLIWLLRQDMDRGFKELDDIIYRGHFSSETEGFDVIEGELFNNKKLRSEVVARINTAGKDPVDDEQKLSVLLRLTKLPDEVLEVILRNAGKFHPGMVLAAIDQYVPDISFVEFMASSVFQDTIHRLTNEFLKSQASSILGTIAHDLQLKRKSVDFISKAISGLVFVGGESDRMADSNFVLFACCN